MQLNPPKPEAELAEPWKISMARWQLLKGVHQPWIAEISPMQLGRMSKRQRKAYDKKREGEWAASGQCKKDYRAAVVAAFDAGLFTPTDPEVADDAKKQVSYALQDRAEAEAEARFEGASRENCPTIEELQVGDRVYSVMGSFYGTVTKKARLSVRIKPEKPAEWMRDGDFKADIDAVQWLHHGELKAAVEAGLPIRPARVAPVRQEA